MPGPFIPLTRARLKPYVTLYAIRGGAFLDTPAAFVNYIATTPASSFSLIGTVEKLTETQTRRENSVYRELNADTNRGTFGNPVESYPGLVSYQLELVKVTLNDANMLEAFGFIGSNLIEQKVPLIIQIVHPVPVDASGSPITVNGVQLKADSRTYYGCWFDSNTLEFEANPGDLKVLQNTTMIATGLVSSKVSIPPA